MVMGGAEPGGPIGAGVAGAGGGYGAGGETYGVAGTVGGRGRARLRSGRIASIKPYDGNQPPSNRSLVKLVIVAYGPN